ncbi:hypothetical protein AK830_g10719 [Neonectria ditissima]|uniref:Fungal N-terminal domain-containing protein n=1 Tax=Neonectria ditissima TaxID=78410 RepID=A0A0N8H5D3_9HYPO|nr:hypothetical protein AK830_g10719 [Neonectria ditissima]
MDPFSITAGCTTLFECIIKTSCQIYSFAINVRGASDELSRINESLLRLKALVCIIRSDAECNDGTSEDQRAVLYEIINQCLNALEDVDAVIKEHDTPLGSMLWAVQGKAKLQELARTLEQSIQQLDLSLSFVNGSVTKATYTEVTKVNAKCGDIEQCLHDVHEKVDLLILQSLERQGCGQDHSVDQVSDQQVRLYQNSIQHLSKPSRTIMGAEVVDDSEATLGRGCVSDASSPSIMKGWMAVDSLCESSTKFDYNVSTQPTTESDVGHLLVKPTFAYTQCVNRPAVSNEPSQETETTSLYNERPYVSKSRKGAGNKAIEAIREQFRRQAWAGVGRSPIPPTIERTRNSALSPQFVRPRRTNSDEEACQKAMQQVWEVSGKVMPKRNLPNHVSPLHRFRLSTSSG